ncbi:DUF1294 domain-containing protein [Sphingomonas sp. Leaf17]|uniref:DUF1294 domain-containing protein n=1 Tax=Sphingomonas sp. Leaf17 TaxID=1735683 RepID=UPI0009E78665|nr:DUF1294 domain-containing protein [Sphingomonas sp. Leaf17]
MILALVCYLLAVNFAAVVAFRRDKALAVRGARRTRESTLLWLAVAGGSPGAIWARRRFRHKTRKQPFAGRLDRIAMVQAGGVVGLVVTLLI